MEVRVLAAKRSDQATLENLAQLYAYDFSEILAHETDATGRFDLPSLEGYWKDPWRFPFLLRAGEHLAGFALVHRKSRLTGAEDVWDMAEFFVLRRHRRAAVGTKAAHSLFAMHSGPWEVRQRSANVGATAFWRSVISSYARGGFTEEVLDDARWQGPVQRFTS